MRDPLVKEELTLHRLQHSVAQMNPFGLPIPPGAMQVDPATGMPVLGAPPAPGGGPAGEPPAPGGVGAARAEQNSLQESGAPDTLPGMAPGGGNMGAPA
jgi:hypothetical protein